MKKLLAVGIILLLVGVSIPSTGRVMEQSSVVSFDGNTLYVGGSGPENYTKIQDAINDSNDGDTIYVYSNTYYECDIEVDKSITLVGEDKNTTIIDGDKKDYSVLELTSDNTTIKGFTIQRAGGSTRDGIVIWSNNNKVINCKILLNVDNGIAIADGSNKNIVSFCEFYNNLWGLQIHGWDEYDYDNVISYCTFGPGDDLEIWKAKNTVITNCIFDESQIQDRATDGTSIINCEFHGWSTGISLIYDGKDVSIENCTFLEHKHAGLETVTSGQYNLTVRNCTFENCGYFGIYFGYLVDSIISDCKFINNTYAGIRFWSGMRRTEVTRCHFERNEDGIRMGYRNWLNKFSENNFINNEHKNVYRDELYIMLNFYSRNYWDDWIGIGPYHVMGLFSWDWNPVSEPYDI